LPGKATYRVRLHFAEPDAVKPGARRFSISVAGKLIRRDLDLAATVGVGRTMVVEVTGVEVDGKLRIELTPANGSLPAVLSGIEVHVD
jgi:hypothetical protein